MAVYMYRNKEHSHVVDIGGVRTITRIILRRAKSKSSFGVCVTSSPINIWILYPKQVFGFRSKGEDENIHVCGFDQGPFAWEDYRDDYYELSAIDIYLLDKLRGVLSEADFQSIMEWVDKIKELSQHINWFANECRFPDYLEECHTETDKVCYFLRNIVDMLSRYFPVVKKQIFV